MSTSDPAPGSARYLVSDRWGHVFVGTQENITRWVYDRQEDKLLLAQVWGAPWAAWWQINIEQQADLLDSLADNDLLGEEIEPGALCDAYLCDTLPEWVGAAGEG